MHSQQQLMSRSDFDEDYLRKCGNSPWEMAKSSIDFVVGIDFGLTYTGGWKSPIHRDYLADHV